MLNIGVYVSVTATISVKATDDAQKAVAVSRVNGSGNTEASTSDNRNVNSTVKTNVNLGG